MTKADISQVDALIRETLDAFTRDLFEHPEWKGKEHDYINRYVHGFLLARCPASTFLYHPTQVGIEVGVKWPPGIGVKNSSRKDIVIWPKPWMSCWKEVNGKYRPFYAPTVVMEWKVVRAGQKVRPHLGDRKWLSGFAKKWPDSLGYMVTMTREPVSTGRIVVARFHDAHIKHDWFLL